jgi:hypothetical protein
MNDYRVLRTDGYSRMRRKVDDGLGGDEQTALRLERPYRGRLGLTGTTHQCGAAQRSAAGSSGLRTMKKRTVSRTDRVNVRKCTETWSKGCRAEWSDQGARAEVGTREPTGIGGYP